MNSYITLLVFGLCVLMAGASLGMAQVHAERIVYGTWKDAVRISNGTVEVVIVPAVGRVMRYALVGGENVLWEHPDAASLSPAAGQWANFGGEKVWLWPQETWAERGRAWPPPGDDGASGVHVSAIGASGVVTMVSPVIAGWGVRIERRFELAETGTRLRTTSRLVGEAGAMVPWSVTQIRSAGTIVALLDSADAPGLTHRLGESALLEAERRDGRVLYLRSSPQASKCGIEADVLAGQVGDLAIVQRIVHGKQPGDWPAGHRAQVFRAQRDAGRPAMDYEELEFTAAPGERVLEMTWELVKPQGSLGEAVAAPGR